MLRSVQLQIRASSTLLSGYRFYEYDTNLSITENLTVLPHHSPLVPGTTFLVQDRFRTHNEFNGGEIGLQGISRAPAGGLMAWPRSLWVPSTAR